MANDGHVGKALVLQNVTVKNPFIDVVFENDLACVGAENDTICGNITKRQVSEPVARTDGTSKSFHGGYFLYGYLPGLAELPEPEKESEPNMALSSEDTEQSWIVSNIVDRQMTDDAEECWPTWHGADAAVGPARGVDMIFENVMVNESSESYMIHQGPRERQMIEEYWQYHPMHLSDCIPSTCAIPRQMTEESWPTWQGAVQPARVLRQMAEESWPTSPYSSDSQEAEVTLPTPMSPSLTSPWEAVAHPSRASLTAMRGQASQALNDLIACEDMGAPQALPAFHASPAHLTDARADRVLPQAWPAASRIAGSSPKPSPGWTDVTTVMMKNLPNEVTQHMLLLLLDNSGFLHSFDFMYLPIDPDTKTNKGFAFINFTNADLALTFRMLFEGQRLDNFKSDKPMSVAPAALQGFDANYAQYYSGARVKRRERGAQPLFLRKPQKVPQAGRHTPDSLIDVASKQLRRQQKQEQLPPKQSPLRTVPAAVTADPAVIFTAPSVAQAAGRDASKPGNASKSRVARLSSSCGACLESNFKFCQFCQFCGTECMLIV
jgi:hypothetical protein